MSPTDVSLTENSWMLRPLNKASLRYCAPDRCVPTLDRINMELDLSAAIAASVDLRHLLDQWGIWPASPMPLTRFIGLAPLRRMHARPTLKSTAVRSQVSLRSIKSKFRDGMGWSGAKIAKGHFVQGMQHPIDQGRTNIAP